MSKFFIPRENISDGKITITGEDVRHITGVLRMKAGDELLCCDGMGYDYRAVISEAGKQQLICDVLEKVKTDTEPRLKVTLIQGIPKGSKMDYIIQKNTELGVSEIYPCAMARCVSKIEGGKKTERWQKIAAEAAKQSGRGIVPTVHDPITPEQAAQILVSADVSFVPYECAEGNYLKPLLQKSAGAETAAFMIGPEGGFDNDEIEALKAAGVPVISLGKRILRTETAGEAVLSMVMYEIGDING